MSCHSRSAGVAAPLVKTSWRTVTNTSGRCGLVWLPRFRWSRPARPHRPRAARRTRSGCRPTRRGSGTGGREAAQFGVTIRPQFAGAVQGQEVSQCLKAAAACRVRCRVAGGPAWRPARPPGSVHEELGGRRRQRVLLVQRRFRRRRRGGRRDRHRDRARQLRRRLQGPRVRRVPARIPAGRTPNPTCCATPRSSSRPSSTTRCAWAPKDRHRALCARCA